MAIDFNNVVRIYQSNIDSLISSSTMAKRITLYFEDTISGVQGTYDDPLRHSDQRMPNFKQENSAIPIPNIVQNTKVIAALIKDNPKEFTNFNIRVDKPNAIIRLKTYLTDVPDLRRCKYIVPHSDVRNIVEARYRLLMEPVPKGLQIDRYAVSYWEHI